MRVLPRCWATVCDLFTGVPEDPGAPRPVTPASSPANGPLDRLNAELLRRPGRLAAACLATVLGPAVVAQAQSVGVQSKPSGQSASEVAPEPVPAPVPGDGVTWLPAARQAAATCPGLPSSILVAIARVESSLGLHSGVSAAGAVGPMQFLPSTWAAYGTDGDGDGITDVMNTLDAVHGAARFLCANGGGDPNRLASALWNYNHSDDYVRHVMAVARFVP